MAKLKLKQDGLRVREKPVDGKPIGQIYIADTIESLESLEDTARKVGVKDQWLRVRVSTGVEGYTAAWMLELEREAMTGAAQSTAAPLQQPPPTTPATPTAAPKVKPIALKPTMEGLRLREKPVDGNPIGQVGKNDFLISLESKEATQSKLGVKDQWLRVKTLYGMDAYTAAWYLAPYEGALPEVMAIPPALNLTGVNLDIYHPLGTPDPARLRGMGWVRFGYNVSAAQGSEDIDAAYNRYKPVLEKYARAGLKVLLVFTHQTYGEGKNEFWPWPSMTTDKWRALTARFADMVARIAKQYAGQNIVHALQIWNEMDAPMGAVASVPMPPSDYGYLLAETIKAVRRVDSVTPIISGGHTGGPQNGGNYARATLKAMHDGFRPDGLAFHPYGRGTKLGETYAPFGHIDDEMQAYLPILPGRPIWITEWGILDRDFDPNDAIMKYAGDFVSYMKMRYPGQVAAMIWYAWAMSMHNGYGLVGREDQPLEPLFSRFKAL